MKQKSSLGMVKEAVLESLYERQYSVFYREINKWLPDASDVEDVLQNAFISVLRQNDAVFQRIPEEKRIAYLLAICRYQAFSAYRNGRKNQGRQNHTDCSCIEDPRMPVEEQVVLRECRKDLSHILEEMPPQYGIPMELRYYYDFNDREIAAQLELSVNNVQVRIHRGKKILRRRMIEEGWFDGQEA